MLYDSLSLEVCGHFTTADRLQKSNNKLRDRRALTPKNRDSITIFLRFRPDPYICCTFRAHCGHVLVYSCLPTDSPTHKESKSTKRLDQRLTARHESERAPRVLFLKPNFFGTTSTIRLIVRFWTLPKIRSLLFSL